MLLLAGDIGGTKTTLAVFSKERGLRDPLAEATFPSTDYDSLETIALTFMSQLERSIDEVDRACFGVAGPVIDGHSKITNLPWAMSETQLSQKLELRTAKLVNDLESIAYSVPILEGGDLHTLNEGQPVKGGSIAILAPGTGLGEGYLTWDGERYNAYGSEGGHGDFAPTNALQLGLLRHLQEKFGHVSSERVCSGMGVPNIYHYLKETGYAQEPPWLTKKLAEVDDPTPIIINTALNQHDASELCDATLDIFVSIIGSEAGNLGLTILSTGGMYLGGGIPRRILPALESSTFKESFHSKGRMSDLLEKMPVHVILNTKAALLGAARYGLEM
jgi:glucokinase